MYRCALNSFLFQNVQFEWYNGDSKNSFVKDGKWHIKPILTQDKIGTYRLDHDYVYLSDCTDSNEENYKQQANKYNSKSFSFKYGRIEVIGKMPNGTFLWPTIRLMPTHMPRPAGINLLQYRDNINYKDDNDIEMGVDNVVSMLYFGTQWNQHSFENTTLTRNNASGHNTTFYKFELIWKESGIKFFIDGTEIEFVRVADGLWRLVRFDDEAGNKKATFNQEVNFFRQFDSLYIT